MLFRSFIGDREVLRSIMMTFPSKKEALEALEKLNKKYPKMCCDCIYAAMWNIAPNHFNTPIFSEFPEKVSLTLKELQNLFTEIFALTKDSKGPLFLDVTQLRKEDEDRSPVSFDELIFSCKNWLLRIQHKVPYSGTPLATDATALQAYYQNLEEKLIFCMFMLQKCIETKKFIIALNAFTRLAMGSFLCGTRWTSEVVEVYEMLFLSLYPEQPTPNLENRVQRMLQKLRSSIFKQKILSKFSRSPHLDNYYLNLIGKYRAIAEAKMAHPDPTFIPMPQRHLGLGKLLEIFDQFYDAFGILKCIAPLITLHEIEKKMTIPKEWKPSEEDLKWFVEKLGMDRDEWPDHSRQIYLERVVKNPQGKGVSWQYLAQLMSEWGILKSIWDS